MAKHTSTDARRRRHAEARALSSDSLYDAMASNDLEGMVLLYAGAAREAMETFSSIRRRWVRSDERAEEKVDEYFHQHRADDNPLPDSYYLDDESKGQSAAPTTLISNHSREIDQSIHLDSTLGELDLILRSRNGEDPMDTDDPRETGEAYGKRCHSIHPSKKTRQSASPPPDRGEDSHHRPFSSERDCDADVVKTKAGLSSDIVRPEHDVIERILWESASIISNSRPSSSFLVFSRRGNKSAQGWSHAPGKSVYDAIELHENESDSEDEVEDDDNDGPPLFDGSVANATPRHATGGSGGSGTAMHLACALDSPFALSVLLTMGVDAASRHTAFRRLAVHESACADSPDCLRLLLELGSEFSYLLPTLTTKSASFRERGAKSRSAASKPIQSFFSGWGMTKRGHNEKMCASAFGDQGVCLKEDIFKKSTSPPKCRGLPFIPTIRMMIDLIEQIQAGYISELDASRHLLSHVNLSIGAKLALAASCLPSSIDGTSSQNGGSPSSLGTDSVTNGNADGHGNTPMHWASFKNSVACVSVLLSHHADPNARAHPSGWTPLHDAAYSNAPGAVSLLLQAGADVDARASSGATPLCFAAQEDAPDAAQLLLNAGADPAVRCCGHATGGGGHGVGTAPGNNLNHHHHPSRFSGYTPLHYCAHYNASRAARVLLESRDSSLMLDIPDLNEKLPIHVAVARGSSDVLREFLHGGARLHSSDNTVSPKASVALSPLLSPASRGTSLTLPMGSRVPSVPLLIPTLASAGTAQPDTMNAIISQGAPPAVTPVSSPVLRSMIPPRPITSSKPWNCLSQKAIDECRNLISEAEMNWTPERHSLFSPTDRRAVVEVLRVGKRLEQVGTGIFIELWPSILRFCGRGWFDVKEDSREDDAGSRLLESFDANRDGEGKRGNLKEPEGRYTTATEDATAATSEDDLALFRLDR